MTVCCKNWGRASNDGKRWVYLIDIIRFTSIGNYSANSKEQTRKEEKSPCPRTTTRLTHMPRNGSATSSKLAKPIVDSSANIMTDAHLSYEGLEQHFRSHHSVDHSKTFVRSVIIHTNFAESYHSLLKRGIIGSYHQLSDKHLHRYLSEFDHKWNTRKLKDGDRAVEVLKAAPGKRLYYSKGSGCLIGEKEDHLSGA